jgi:uncharacterized membrane protein YoaK (UPF0700 family)
MNNGSIKETNDYLEAKDIGCNIFDYDLYKKNKRIKNKVLFIVYCLFFIIGVIVGVVVTNLLF